jgi:hypothetical protein
MLSALSLLLPGRVEISGVYLGYEPMDVFGGGLMPASSEMYRVPANTDLDAVSEQIGKVFSVTNSLKPSAGYGLALRRLWQSAAREYIEDRILDLIIAAENLFLADSNDELSYKLAVRCAYYLAPTDAAERHRIYDLIKAAYGQRGKVAHGRHAAPDVKVNGTRVPTKDVFDQVETLLRRAFQKRLLETPGRGIGLRILGPRSADRGVYPPAARLTAV